MGNAINLEKKNAAEAAVEEIKSGMTIGLGTGSTAYYAIHRIGEKLAEGLLTKIRAVASSDATRKLASDLNIPIVAINDVEVVDITIDGADEFDDEFNLIKGGGGALLQEKIIAFLSRRFLVIADASKFVATLGAFKLPVEVMKITHMPIRKLLLDKGYRPELRKTVDGDIYVTDNGNYVIDCDLRKIDNPGVLEGDLMRIPGVVETGLFLNMAHKVYMGVGTAVSEVPNPKKSSVSSLK